MIGCLLGTAVGDALGLPYEKLSPKRAAKLLGPPDRYRFLFRRGMISDDTEHSCLVAQSLIQSRGDVAKFRHSLSWHLRWWVLSFPAGIGRATALSGIKLWLRWSNKAKTGINSAGNGPAMRSAILGVAIDDHRLLLDHVRVSARLTHSDPKAEYGAIAVALAAREASRNQTIDANRWLDDVVSSVGNEGSELIELLYAVVESVARGETTNQYVAASGMQSGVSGYTYHTVPAAIHAWLSHPHDFRAAVTETIECGGDADTTAAIVGGIVGASVGRDGIPPNWLDEIREWPRSIAWIEDLARRLANTIGHDSPVTSPSVNPFAVIARNLLFLSVVLFHGFRRLAPPY